MHCLKDYRCILYSCIVRYMDIFTVESQKLLFICFNVCVAPTETRDQLAEASGISPV